MMELYLIDEDPYECILKEYAPVRPCSFTTHSRNEEGSSWKTDDVFHDTDCVIDVRRATTAKQASSSLKKDVSRQQAASSP
jgi:hypothetical protein